MLVFVGGGGGGGGGCFGLAFFARHEKSKHLKITKMYYSRDCLNGHLFHPATCLYGQLSVTPLRFYSLFDSCITVATRRGHGQPICTPK